jgi:hypothetical protein
MAVDMGGVYAGLQNDAPWAVESRPLAANPAHTGEAAPETSLVDFAALHESGSAQSVSAASFWLELLSNEHQTYLPSKLTFLPRTRY